MSAEEAAKRGLTPLARIVAHATHSQAPEWFTTAPVTAIANVLGKAGWKAEEVDLFEVNEAFACVAMAPMRELGIPHEKLNVNGGACRAGSSDRCQRRPPARHAAACPESARRQARRRRTVHRRRRSDGRCCRDCVKAITRSDESFRPNHLTRDNRRLRLILARSCALPILTTRKTTCPSIRLCLPWPWVLPWPRARTRSRLPTRPPKPAEAAGEAQQAADNAAATGDAAAADAAQAAADTAAAAADAAATSADACGRQRRHDGRRRRCRRRRERGRRRRAGAGLG